jgi:hypothetical protein
VRQGLYPAGSRGTLRLVELRARLLGCRTSLKQGCVELAEPSSVLRSGVRGKAGVLCPEGLKFALVRTKHLLQLAQPGVL